MGLTIQEAKRYFGHYRDVTIHKYWVAHYLIQWWKEDKRPIWLWKAIKHDLSKYGKQEAPYFAKTNHLLAHTEYGTDEYRSLLDRIRPALDHHYAVNDHHPEFYKNGVYGMHAEEQVEMICDWAAAIRRSKDGNMAKSLDINRKRFKYDEHYDETFRYIATEIGAYSPA